MSGCLKFVGFAIIALFLFGLALVDTEVTANGIVALTVVCVLAAIGWIAVKVLK